MNDEVMAKKGQGQGHFEFQGHVLRNPTQYTI